MSAVHTMLSYYYVFLVAVVIITSLLQSSVSKSINEVSEVSEAAASIPGPLKKTEFSVPSSVHPRRLDKVEAMPKAYINTRSPPPSGHIAFKFLHRGPDYEILPIRIGALALHNFYTSISHLSSTVWSQTRRPTNVVRITQEALQLTILGIGTNVPWDFVEDWAIKAAESVVRGWTDTFDAGYEIEGTGVGMWVSLRILEGWLPDEDAMSMS